jgi:hypothetical protein
MATTATASIWTDPAAVSGRYARRTLEYGDAVERIVNRATAPGFEPSEWDELTGFIDVARFERVGNDKAAMGWDVYRQLLTGWASHTASYVKIFRRVAEVGNVVFLELEERNVGRDGAESVVNSCTVYEYDDAGKLVHLDIYLQHA